MRAAKIDEQRVLKQAREERGSSKEQSELPKSGLLPKDTRYSSKKSKNENKKPRRGKFNNPMHNEGLE